MFNFHAKSEELYAGLSVGSPNDATARWNVLFGSGYVLIYP